MMLVDELDQDFTRYPRAAVGIVTVHQFVSTDLAWFAVDDTGVGGCKNDRPGLLGEIPADGDFGLGGVNVIVQKGQSLACKLAACICLRRFAKPHPLDGAGDVLVDLPAERFNGARGNLLRGHPGLEVFRCLVETELAVIPGFEIALVQVEQAKGVGVALVAVIIPIDITPGRQVVIGGPDFKQLVVPNVSAFLLRGSNFFTGLDRKIQTVGALPLPGIVMSGFEDPIFAIGVLTGQLGLERRAKIGVPGQVEDEPFADGEGDGVVGWDIIARAVICGYFEDVRDPGIRRGIEWDLVIIGREKINMIHRRCVPGRVDVAKRDEVGDVLGVHEWGGEDARKVGWAGRVGSHGRQDCTQDGWVAAAFLGGYEHSAGGQEDCQDKNEPPKAAQERFLTRL